MGAIMLVMMVVVVFAFPMHGFHGTTAHDPDTDQMREHSSATSPDRDPGRHAEVPDQQRQSVSPTTQK
ncbi:MAG: hypothetical protein HY661_04895 [Betaproteobacteria bacterium]|nr:hypothetical protein [Betaproteobacteria bacterium]